MALLRIAMVRTSSSDIKYALAFKKGFHGTTHPPPPPPLDIPISKAATASPPVFILPEFERSLYRINNGLFGSGYHIGNGFMDLMAVPKKKTSPHKRGIRNGPKALKPIPVIIRCKACGRVKLPHFFCCSGLRDSNGHNGSSS